MDPAGAGSLWGATATAGYGGAQQQELTRGQQQELTWAEQQELTWARQEEKAWRQQQGPTWTRQEDLVGSGMVCHGPSRWSCLPCAPQEQVLSWAQQVELPAMGPAGAGAVVGELALTPQQGLATGAGMDPRA